MDLNSTRILLIGQELGGFEILKFLLQEDGNLVGVVSKHPSERENVVNYRRFNSLLESESLKHIEVESVKNNRAINFCHDIQPDLIVVAYWSELVPGEILDLASLGSVGFHLTMLPLHRGRAPIPWSIILGLKKSGVTMFFLTEGPDEGRLIGRDEYKISKKDDARSIYDKSVSSSINLLRSNLANLLDGSVNTMGQPHEYDYWRKRTPKDGVIDWNMDANHMYDWIRALTDPFPGAYSFFKSEKVYFWSSEIESETKTEAEPGEIIEIAENELIVQCGEGIIRITDFSFGCGKAGFNDGNVEFKEGDRFTLKNREICDQ